MTLLATFVFVAVAAVVSAQQVPAAPGRFVDIGGRKLHINCAGSGWPTVVLESGASVLVRLVVRAAGDREDEPRVLVRPRWIRVERSGRRRDAAERCG